MFVYYNSKLCKESLWNALSMKPLLSSREKPCIIEGKFPPLGGRGWRANGMAIYLD